MADQPTDERETAPQIETPVIDEANAAQPEVPSAEIQKFLEQLPARELVSMLISQTTRFGPDPETAKILVQAEQHEESCRLEAYKATLENREKESVRDHEYRVKKLDREFWMSLVVLLGAIALCIVGVYLIVIGQTTLGSNLLIGGAGLLLYVLKGNTAFFRSD